MKLKYQVGQRFRCLVAQRLVLGMANGVPTPFGQVASDTKRAKAQGVDVPVGTIVVLEADFQCQLPDGTTKRAYVLRVEGRPVFFADRVLTRKYERVLAGPMVGAVGAASILEEEDARILKELTDIAVALPGQGELPANLERDLRPLLSPGPCPFTPFGRNAAVTSLTEEDVKLLQGQDAVQGRMAQAFLADARACLDGAKECLAADAEDRGIDFLPELSERPCLPAGSGCRDDGCPGTYVETSLHDDIDGVLHCSECGDCVDRGHRDA